MNRGTRMLLLNSSKDKDKERRRRMGVTYEDWTPQSHWGPICHLTTMEEKWSRKGLFTTGEAAGTTTAAVMRPWAHTASQRAPVGTAGIQMAVLLPAATTCLWILG